MSNKENQRGLIVSYHGSSVTVRADDGQVYHCHLRRNQVLPVVGDYVVWQLEQGNTGTISDIEPRKSLLSRCDGHDKMKAIAANIDIIAVVMSPPPIFSEYLIDRYLVAAELLKIKPMIVMNKIDLLDDSTRAAAEARLKPYRDIGYTVVLSSVYLENGLDTLAAELKNKCAVLVGASGVGKSSIIGALAQDDAIQIAEVTKKGIGKHTTSGTRLYSLPEGASVIDSPGVREFNLWPISKQELLNGFCEFRQFLSGCKFRDCQHVVEPGCAVLAAVAGGKISATRFANFQELMKKTTDNRT